MYRLLIVDDEPIIVQGLNDLFNELSEEMDLDVYYAYSGQEALSWLQRLKIDIVLTDIQMPVMNGLELQKVVMRYWPQCKVIFLTGYNEFAYVQTAIRNGSVDYVLKTEGDQSIILAVQKAIAGLSEEIEAHQLIHNANEQIRKATPYLQKEFLLEWLNGLRNDSDTLMRRMEELQIPLQADRPVLMVAGRVDRWRPQVLASEKSLMLFALHNIAEEYMQDRVSLLQITYQPDRWVWLIQPKSMNKADEAWSMAVPYILGNLESVQVQSKQLLKLPCSFVMTSQPSSWELLAKKFDRLKWKLNLGSNIAEEMLLTDEHAPAVTKDEPGIHYYSSRIGQLEIFLESGQQEDFSQLFTELMQEVSSLPPQLYGIMHEIYYSIVVMFLSCLNRWNLMEDLSVELDLGKLTKLEDHASWSDISAYFLELASLFFERRQNEYDVKSRDVIRQIDEYIHQHLDGDLSQTRLAEVVYLSPSYMSRLYKQMTGISLSDYIMDTRIQTAKQKLKDHRLKIHEVAASVGFESASYFSRFFKKYTNLTPMEFREQLGGDHSI